VAIQDWSEAARFFLVGLSHNSSDPNMEQGFQTNVDMLRAQRRRLVERSLPNKWEDVLSFKPKTMVVRPPSPEDKPPWHRLGPVFEEIVAEPVCHIKDLLESQQVLSIYARLLAYFLDATLPCLCLHAPGPCTGPGASISATPHTAAHTGPRAVGASKGAAQASNVQREAPQASCSSGSCCPAVALHVQYCVEACVALCACCACAGSVLRGFGFSVWGVGGRG